MLLHCSYGLWMGLLIFLYCSYCLWRGTENNTTLYIGYDLGRSGK